MLATGSVGRLIEAAAPRIANCKTTKIYALQPAKQLTGQKDLAPGIIVETSGLRSLLKDVCRLKNKVEPEA